MVGRVAARVGAIATAVPVVVPAAIVHLHRADQQAVGAQVDDGVTGGKAHFGLRQGVCGGHVAGQVLGKTHRNVDFVQRIGDAKAVAGRGFDGVAAGQGDAQVRAVGNFGARNE